MKKRTQNPNKSLHSKLWLKRFKVKDAKPKRVCFCTYETVLHHNIGEFRGSLLGKLGLLNYATVEKQWHWDSTPAKIVPTKKRRTDEAFSEDYVPGGF